jgi:hypothetical protein
MYSSFCRLASGLHIGRVGAGVRFAVKSAVKHADNAADDSTLGCDAEHQRFLGEFRRQDREITAVDVTLQHCHHLDADRG